jgi:hypothetical protein
LPFHAAEQRSKELINDSAERSDFPRRLHFVSSTGQFAKGEPSEPAAFSFGSFSLGKQRK